VRGRRLPVGLLGLAVATTGVLGGGAASAVLRGERSRAAGTLTNAAAPGPGARGAGTAQAASGSGGGRGGATSRRAQAHRGGSSQLTGTVVGMTPAGHGRPPKPINPDVEVLFSAPASTRVIHALEHLPGVTASTVLAVGRVGTPVGPVTAVGVDPSGFRPFTPVLSDESDPLWGSVRRGEVTLSFSTVKSRRRLLGATVPIAGKHSARLRIGAFAAIGLPAVGMMSDAATASRLGLGPRRMVILAAPHEPVATLTAAARAVAGPAATIQDLAPPVVNQAEISSLAAETIPASYLRLYRAAALTCPGLPWTVLAGIGAIETGHGRYDHTSSAGAEGPMQFLPSTFAVYGYDPYHRRPNIWSPLDAIYSAARYLCAQGAGRGGQSLLDAIYAYNHAVWYVKEVLAMARAYS
jgi:hypothetical protein